MEIYAYTGRQAAAEQKPRFLRNGKNNVSYTATNQIQDDDDQRMRRRRTKCEKDTTELNSVFVHPPVDTQLR